MYVLVYIVFISLLPQPVLLQQSAFQRALIKNANNAWFTSAERGLRAGWRGRKRGFIFIQNAMFERGERQKKC